MRRFLEAVRFFIFSPELVVVLLGLFANTCYYNEMQRLFGHSNLPDEQLKFLTTIPVGLCAWSFVSGRKLLFPDKDKYNVLQIWPDYWRLKIGFQASLVWSVIFAVSSILVWFGDWKHPSPTTWILFFASLAGSALSSLSIYNAQLHVEEETSLYKGPK